MKFPNRCLALFLCIIMALSVSNTVLAVNSTTDSEDVQVYSVPIISNEYNGSHVDFYGVDGKYYLSFNDIKELTRFELEETDTTITLTQGLRELVIEKSSGHLIDCDLVDQGNIDIVHYDGKYLCEGIPMLMYLGAACALNGNQVLEVMMPTITIWESIMPDYLDYYFNITDLYGGEDNIKISLACDIIADLLDGISGHGLFANGDTHLEDALYEILSVDMMKYESVQESIAAQNQSVNEFLVSEGLSTFLDGSSSGVDSVSELLDYYADFYLNGEILKNETRWQRSYNAGDLDTASSLSKEINQQVYEQSVIKANLGNTNNIGDVLDIGMIALNTAITSYNLMQYDDDTKNLFSRTISEEIFRDTGYNDISWNNITDKISKNLSSNASIVQSSALNSVVDYMSGEITENGIEFVLSKLTSKANIYVAATQLATFVASLINHDTNQAFSADMNAIWLNTVQYDVAQLTSRMLVKERDEYHFSDIESLTKLKDMFTLYYRTIIAFSENIAKSIEEFGGKNRNEWMQYFGGTSGKSVNNYAAIYLYRITNCEIIPIVKYSNLTDDLLESNWLKTFKREDADIFSLLPSEFVFASGTGGWSTEITLNDDGTFNGQYHDSDMGDSGPGYSNGTVYICDFSGKFTMPRKINDHIYSMKLESLDVEETSGTVYYENDIRYIVSDPYGFDNADEFMIYFPGIVINNLPEGFINWLYAFINVQTTEVLPFYGIYNVGGKQGFVAYNVGAGGKDTEITYEMRTETIEFRLSDGTLYYSNTIEYPYFSGNSAIESTLNQRYADMISDCKTNDTDFDASYQENLEWGSDVSALPFYDDTLSEVVYNDRGALSIKETYSMWSGGAHPYYDEVTLNYNLTTGNELTYADILSGTNQEIDSTLRYYFEKYLGTPTDYEISALKEHTPYAFCKDGLCFYYHVGDAVPRAKIIIPYTSDETYVISVDKLLQ